ncbi:hypothetical protein WMO13_06715 [Ignatzschineria larvae DSM 13226]|uniref:Uncharacterized protein n=1 Tax=Ignatzschineria larvae DSM 13226 TaxID=1111732 RepID=A0ABZ3BX30_9GAMM|nr:hypothetical protein [Ignatzschineria larvae]
MAYSAFKDRYQLNKTKYGIEALEAVERNDLVYIFENIYSLSGALESELIDVDFVYRNMSQLNDEQLEKMMLDAHDEEAGQSRRGFSRNQWPRLLLDPAEVHRRTSMIKEDLFFEYRRRKFGEPRPERRYGKIEATPKMILESNGQMSLF